MRRSLNNLNRRAEGKRTLPFIKDDDQQNGIIITGEGWRLAKELNEGKRVKDVVFLYEFKVSFH